MNQRAKSGAAPMALAAGLGLVLAASVVRAQSPPPSPPPAANNDELQGVVVTGSRVVTNGAQAPTPTTAVAAQMLQAAAPSSVVDALVQLPQIVNSSVPQSTGVGTTGTVGQSFLSLRGLGSNRTLTLLDGARLVPSSLQAATDVSLIPEALIN